MSDGKLDLDSEDKLDPSQAPGCGLAVYAGLLMTMCVLGLIGMGLSTWGLLGSLGQQNPMELMSGSEVDSWRLQPMRDAGLLAEGELPLAWHDESPDLSGSTACAMTAEGVLRIDQGDSRSLPFDDMEDAEILAGASGEVVLLQARDGQGEDVGCRFQKREGGNRFLRQVQVELLKRERGVK